MLTEPNNIVALPAIIQPSAEQRDWDDAKAAFAKIGELDRQRSDAIAEAGRRALQLKERTPTGWEKACKERLGVTPQWANTCIRIFQGTTSREELSQREKASREKATELRNSTALSDPEQEDDAPGEDKGAIYPPAYKPPTSVPSEIKGGIMEHLAKLGPNPTLQVYGELLIAYDFFNRELFDGKLPPVIITLRSSKSHYGHYAKGQFHSGDGQKIDEIVLSARYFSHRSEHTMSTLVHEMVHHWQEHFGTTGSGGYHHNREWADKMKEVGLQPSDTFAPGGKETGHLVGDYIVEGGRFAVALKKLENEVGLTALTWWDKDQEPEDGKVEMAA